jgi:hypothetical protein
VTTRRLRRRGAQAPRTLRRRTGAAAAAAADATLEPDPGPGPEVVFDRVTGPYAHRRVGAGPGSRDEEP